MLSLMNKAFEPSVSFEDKVTYINSLEHLQSIRADNGIISVEKIKDLLTTSSSRVHGLQLLEIALEQNSDIYVKGRWDIILLDILKENAAPVLKEQACRILCMILPLMRKDTTIDNKERLDRGKFVRNLMAVLLKTVEANLEWTEDACRCIYASMRNFPKELLQLQDHLLNIILKQVTFCVSSKTFEIFADIFSYLPFYIVISSNKGDFKKDWNHHYLKTFNTMQQILNTFLQFLANDPYAETKWKTNNHGLFVFESDDHNQDVFQAYMAAARRYINLCKCLSKMLSNQTKHAVEIPVKLTLTGMIRIFEVRDLSKIKISSIELKIICSTLSQMQIASLVVLESLILNLVPHSLLVAQLMHRALQASKSMNISGQPVSQLRLAIWKFLNVWIGKHGNKVVGDILRKQFGFPEELLKDISIEEKEYSQVTAIQSSSKSKKTQSTNIMDKSVNKLDQKVCQEALKSLENLAYIGVNHIPRKMFQEIFSKLIQVASLCLSSQCKFPYDYASCRKNLYSTLLAFTVVSKPNQRDPVQSATRIFKLALRDPSVKVTRFCHKAMATCRLFLHPRKPLPKFRDLEDTQRPSNVSNTIIWSTEDFVPNLSVENVPKAPENIPRIAQIFHNQSESTMQQDEHMEEDVEEKTHYPEHAYQEYPDRYVAVADSQRNREDVLEIALANQCQDDVESEDEEEDEDEERSSGEEEIIQEDMPQESRYIPTTSKFHILSSVHIASEAVPQNVGDQEYEQLKHCSKAEDNIVDSNKNMHLNGVRSVVTDENVPSSSTQTLSSNTSNENGIYDDEEEDIEDEDEGDEEEELVSFPAEKKVPDFYTPTPPSKRQKLENEEVNNKKNDEVRETSASPTVDEMKADFHCDTNDIKC